MEGKNQYEKVSKTTDSLHGVGDFHFSYGKRWPLFFRNEVTTRSSEMSRRD
jgi:hypothetical protein